MFWARRSVIAYHIDLFFSLLQLCLVMQINLFPSSHLFVFDVYISLGKDSFFSNRDSFDFV